jgi:hypothetical protein
MSQSFSNFKPNVLKRGRNYKRYSPAEKSATDALIRRQEAEEALRNEVQKAEFERDADVISKAENEIKIQEEILQDNLSKISNETKESLGVAFKRMMEQKTLEETQQEYNRAVNQPLSEVEIPLRQSETANLGPVMEPTEGSNMALTESLLNVNHPLGFLTLGAMGGVVATVVGNIISDVVYDKTRTILEHDDKKEPQQVSPMVIVKNDPLVNIYKQRISQTQKRSKDVILHNSRISSSL